MRLTPITELLTRFTVSGAEQETFEFPAYFCISEFLHHGNNH